MRLLGGNMKNLGIYYGADWKNNAEMFENLKKAGDKAPVIINGVFYVSTYQVDKDTDEETIESIYLGGIGSVFTDEVEGDAKGTITVNTMALYKTTTHFEDKDDEVSYELEAVENASIYIPDITATLEDLISRVEALEQA